MPFNRTIDTLSEHARRAIIFATICFSAPGLAADGSADPYSFDAQYRLDYWTGLSGRLKSRVRHAGNLDLRLSVDASKAWGWEDTRFLVHAIATHGNHPNGLQGTAQGFDNIEVTVNTTRIFQAWGETNFFDERLSVLFGLLDLNAEFQVTESSATLIHPSFGTGSELAQTGRAGPSVFPLSSLALRAAWKFNDEISLRTALFDGVPGDPAHPRGTHIRLGRGDGTLLINELAYSQKANEHSVNKLAVGAWRYSSRFNHHLDTDSNGDPVRHKNRGAYILGERTVWQINEGGSRGVDAFFRLGWAAGAVNQMDTALGAGLLWRGPFESRPQDKLTFGIAAEHNSHKWRAAKRAAGEADPPVEAAYEISYRAVVNDWFSLQPDVQWVRSHGNSAPNNKALLLGLRLDFTF